MVVDLLALLPMSPAQELFGDVLDLLQVPLIGVEVRHQLNHHLP
jgi:hypothetical protein